MVVKGGGNWEGIKSLTRLVLHEAMEAFGDYGYEGAILPSTAKGARYCPAKLIRHLWYEKRLVFPCSEALRDEKRNAAVKYLKTSESAKQGIADVFHEAAKV